MAVIIGVGVGVGWFVEGEVGTPPVRRNPSAVHDLRVSEGAGQVLTWTWRQPDTWGDESGTTLHPRRYVVVITANGTARPPLLWGGSPVSYTFSEGDVVRFDIHAENTAGLDGPTISLTTTVHQPPTQDRWRGQGSDEYWRSSGSDEYWGSPHT